MNFSSASKVLDTLRASDQVETVRGENRRKVIDLFNGVPPLSDDDAAKMGLRVNTNFGEAPVIAAHARRQYDNAVLGTQNFFTITIPLAPARPKQKWEAFITQFINRVMKLSESYACLKEYQTASIILSGVGPQLWRDQESWEPDYVAVEDLRIPTDTKTSLKGLPWFAERHMYYPGELSRKVFGTNSDDRWHKPAIQKILDAYQEANYENTEYTWLNSPEKMADLHRQNAGFYSSDAVPTIPLWHFYYEDDSVPTKASWKLCVVPDYNELMVRGAPENEFLYDSAEPCAEKISQLLHIQFGDLNTKPPFMYHSVRSLGLLLMEPCFWTNLTRCRELQHLHESMNIMFRVSDPAGKQRAKNIQLFDRAILEEGVSIVPQAERHQVDAKLIEMVMAQLKQLQGEASVSYTQDVDTGTRKEQTAFETHAKLTSVNAMMGALLARYFRRETYAYREICRRFCLRKSSDADARRFQEEAKEFGIPLEFLNVEYWEIRPEVPLGSGNQTMAMAQAQQMMAVRTMHDSAGQQQILHMYDEAILGDSKMAELLAPMDKQREVSDSTRDAEFAFATLMHGVPVRMKQGLSPIDQVETLLGLMAGVIARIEKQSNLATPSELAGLQEVATYVQPLIQQLAQDKSQKALANNYGKMLGKLMNSLKGFAQRLTQEAEAKNGQNGYDPETKGKIAATIIKAQTDAKVKEGKAKQQQAHKEKGFIAEQRRRDAGTFADIARERELAKAKARYSAFDHQE